MVIDSSLLVKYLLKEPNYDAIERYLVEGVFSVDHIIKETSNAIWKHAVLYKKIAPNDARELFRALLMLLEGGLVAVEPQERYVHQAFEIALDHEITVYDALYIAQAKTKNSKLLTSDKLQVAVAEKLGVEALCL